MTNLKPLAFAALATAALTAQAQSSVTLYGTVDAAVEHLSNAPTGGITRMPGLTGIECQRVMKEHGVDLPVIFITGHGDIDMAVQAVLEGAVDFIQKPVDEERLLKDITKACERSVQKVTGSVSADTARERLAALTARETEIVRLIAQGLVSREIAERLGIALRTVEVHRASALKKIGTHDPAVIRRILVAAGA